MTLSDLAERYPGEASPLRDPLVRVVIAQCLRDSSDPSPELPSPRYIDQLFLTLEELEGRWPAPPPADQLPAPLPVLSFWRRYRERLDELGRTDRWSDLWELPSRLEEAGLSPRLVVVDGWPVRSEALERVWSALRGRAAEFVDLSGLPGDAEPEPPPLLPPAWLERLCRGEPAVTPGMPQGIVHRYTATDEQDELEAMARALRSTLDAHPNANVVVALADLPRYAERVLEVFPTFGLEPSLGLRRPLAGAASAGLLRSVLRVIGGNYGRDDVFELLERLADQDRLRGWFPPAADLPRIREVVLRNRVRSGREFYVDLSSPAGGSREGFGEPGAAGVSEGFRRLFAELPRADAVPPRAFLVELRACLARLLPSPDEEAARVLAMLSEAEEVLEADGRHPWPFRDLSGLLELLLQGETLPTRAPPSGLTLTGLRDAAELSCDWLFLGGLRRGAYPSSGPSALVPLRSRKAFGLPEEEELREEERRLFFSLLSRPTRGLYLSYPRLVDGEESSPSSFLDDLGELGEPSPFARRPATGPFHSWKDGLVALGRGEVAGWDSEGEEGKTAPPPGVLAAARTGLQQERLRRRAPRSGELDGPAGGPNARALAEKYLSRGSVSVSRLEEYLRCPYRFYLAQLYRIPEEEEVPEEYDGRLTGELLHAVLATLQEGTRGPDGSLRPLSSVSVRELWEFASARLGTELSQLKPQTPGLEAYRQQILGPVGEPSRGSLWELLTTLAEDSDEHPPRFVELGIGAAPRGLPPTSSHPPDLPPWPLGRAAGTDIQLVGRVDRVCGVRGDPLGFLVDDLKTGRRSPDFKHSEEEPPSLQLPLYAAALESLLPGPDGPGRGRPSGLRYLWWGPPGRVRIETYSPPRGVELQAGLREEIDRARGIASTVLAHLAEGRFPINGRYVGRREGGCRFASDCPHAAGCRFDLERLSGSYEGVGR
jgi:RecB family exonuclease